MPKTSSLAHSDSYNLVGIGLSLIHSVDDLQMEAVTMCLAIHGKEYKREHNSHAISVQHRIIITRPISFPQFYHYYRFKTLYKFNSIKMRFFAIISVAVTLMGFASARPSQRSTGMRLSSTLFVQENQSNYLFNRGP